MILQNGKRLDGCSDTVPVGTLQPFLGLVPPKGYLACQGQLVSKITYKELYEICGNAFGTATETHFYLPDLRGKTLAGYDENDSTMNTIGKLLGQKTHTHTSAAHTHTVAGHVHTTGNHTLTVAEMPSHTHAMETVTEVSSGAYAGRYMTGKTSSNPNLVSNPPANTGGGGAHNHGNTGSTALTSDSTTPGATGSNSNYQPTITVNWIVKAVMLIPNYIIVEDRLDSDSAADALSARQGKLLNDKFTDYATKSEMIQYLPLSGGTMTGEIVLGQGDYKGIQLGTGGRINATVNGVSNATVLGLNGEALMVGTTALPLYLRGNTTMPFYNGTRFIETGSNANGSWIKFADGTMICRHTKSVSVDCNSQWGNLYEGGATIGDMPATFTGTPTVMVTNTQPDGYLEGVRDSSATAWGTLRMAIPSSATRAFVVNLIAIGSWK